MSRFVGSMFSFSSKLFHKCCVENSTCNVFRNVSSFGKLIDGRIQANVEKEISVLEKEESVAFDETFRTVKAIISSTDNKQMEEVADWCEKDGVGLIAINDALMLETNIYHLLRLYLSEKSNYSRIIDLFLQVTRKTVYGQTLDVLSAPPGKKPNFNLFTMNHENQKQCLRENYALPDLDAVNRVKQIYDDLKIASIYKGYEEDAKNDICNSIEKTVHSTGLNPLIFYSFLAKIINRKK
ncbi:farnesyl pyrophosphate synthase-like protein [Leptotrombidium deliense]|uniref:Farnesyl pyrophosphate synthase-like protein n=1 Tax=Leptotrombidium deliense TaxID=299467 RepID=A0A443S6F7_9ACAR|nr:farnesyl pyrophosphate synthase-like protein [Leptotrombidium deliense]